MQNEPNVGVKAFNRRKAALLAAHDERGPAASAAPQQKVLSFTDDSALSIYLRSNHSSVSSEISEDSSISTFGRDDEPTKESSKPDVCASQRPSKTCLTVEEELEFSIPSLDQKALTMLNVNDSQFLHSSTTSPIQPVREPSNPNLCPSFRSSRTCLPTTNQGKTDLSKDGASADAVSDFDVPPASILNSKQPLRMASVKSLPSLEPASSSLMTEEEDGDEAEDIQSQPDDGENVLSPNCTIPKDSELVALKKSLTDLGQCIEAIEKPNYQASLLEKKRIREAWDSFINLIDSTLLHDQYQPSRSKTKLSKAIRSKDVSKSRSRSSVNTKESVISVQSRACNSAPPLSSNEKTQSRSSSSRTAIRRKHTRKVMSERSGRSTTSKMREARQGSSKKLVTESKSKSKSTESVDDSRSHRRTKKEPGMRRSVTTPSRRKQRTYRERSSHSSVRSLSVADLYNPNTSQRRLLVRKEHNSRRSITSSSSDSTSLPINSNNDVSLTSVSSVDTRPTSSTSGGLHLPLLQRYRRKRLLDRNRISSITATTITGIHEGPQKDSRGSSNGKNQKKIMSR